MCPRDCGVQWRMGNRQTRKAGLWCKRHESGGHAGRYRRRFWWPWK